jgi:3-hydroxy acid dehydrogenase / malonic semialdehyde reductase
LKKIVFITGATSGFGEACAYKFAENGWSLILNGRRMERLKEISTTLKQKFATETFLLPFDVRNQKAVSQQVETLPEEWRKVDVLINNAGLALGRDLFQEGNVEDWDTMLDTNVKGLIYVSKAVLPFMITRKKGHVINLGSVAGKEVYERGNVYCASKFAVDALTKSMRVDLLQHGIKVTGIHPGAADTEFSIVRFKGNEEAAKKMYEGYQPLTAGDVADAIFYTASLPSNVCINDLVITCTAQANAIYFNKSS